MKKLILTFSKLALFAILCCIISLRASAGEITGLRTGQGMDSVRIVFDASSDFHYEVFLLDTPKRLVIDVDGINVARSIENSKDKSSKLTPNFMDVVYISEKPEIIEFSSFVGFVAPKRTF